MEANLCNQERNITEDCNDNGCLRRNYHPIPQNPTMVRQHVRTMDCDLAACEEPEISDQMEPEEGYFYEIDHTMLPPRSPIQLKSVRIAMVTEKTELNVTVKFPSNLSLRTYFNMDSSSESSQDLIASKVQPALDEQFVMGSRLATKVLIRLVPSSELLIQKNSLSFWLAPLIKSTESSFTCVATKEGLVNDPVVKGQCWSALKCGGQVHWGVRRRVTFIGRHKDKAPQLLFTSVSEGEEDDEEDAATQTITTDEVTTRKRKRESSRRIRMAKSARKREKEKLSGCNSKPRGKPQNGSKDRWSTERYKLAEQKLLEIMKEKEAVIGQPMLRPALRHEARKQIGDTGLLDHLLKHMAGKVAPGGTERFRRRHNPEGAMEYWLESADLVNIRNQAGVSDPYWFPPPGWKPGDSPSEHAVCTREMNLLKEEMATFKRQVLELLSKKQQEDEDEAAKEEKTNAQLESATVASRQEIYENLMKRKDQLEQQLLQISNSLKEMQEELGKLSSSSSSMEDETARSTVVVVEEEKEKEAAKGTNAAAADVEKQDAEKDEEDAEKAGKKAAEAAKAEMRQRLRSGFRICKPQGTFLWPNMVGSVGSNILSPPQAGHASHSQVVVQVEDLLMVPTPPSVSSATSSTQKSLPIKVAAAAPFPYPQQPSPSPVKPLAEKRGFKVTVSSSIVIPDQSTTCQGDNISTATTVPPPPYLNLDFNDGRVPCDVAVVSSGSTTTMTSGADHLLDQHYHRQHQHWCSSSVDTRLALSTPNP